MMYNSVNTDIFFDLTIHCFHSYFLYSFNYSNSDILYVTNVNNKRRT